MKFKATIEIINGNPYVRPPDKILNQIFKQANKKTSPIPIKGRINNAIFKQSLVRYQGDWRLYVNIIMARASNLHFSKSISEIVGAGVDLEIEFNSTPPTYEMLPFFQKALDENSIAKNNWEKLIPSRKKEILRYLSWLKSDEARNRNLEKAMHMLSGNPGRFMARSWDKGK